MKNLINPLSLIQAIKTISLDVSNYLFYRSKILKISNEGFFKDLNMRIDWINRVYYVVNLEPETMLATGELIDLEKSRVFESVLKYEKIFAENLLTELVDINSTRIKTQDYYGYLITINYRFLSKKSDFFTIARWTALIALICFNYATLKETSTHLIQYFIK
jgi:hypothetical protein